MYATTADPSPLPRQDNTNPHTAVRLNETPQGLLDVMTGGIVLTSREEGGCLQVLSRVRPNNYFNLASLAVSSRGVKPGAPPPRRPS